MTPWLTNLSERRGLLHDEEGGVSAEYVVVLLLVAIVSIGAWQSYQQTIEDDAAAQYQTFGYPAD